MARPSGEKTRCGGAWTEARFNSFIKSGLRQLSRKWGPMQQCLKDARVGRGEYLCAECEEVVSKSRLDDDTRKRVNNVHIDHIEPVVPTTGFTNWDDCISRMFVEVDGFQLLCGACHKVKTQEENAERKLHRGKK